MNLEEMQQTWQTEAKRLNQAIRLSETHQIWHRIQRLQTPMRRVTVALCFEIAVAAMALIVLGGFLADHRTQPRFLWPAGLLHLWCLGALISSIRQMLLATQLNYDETIAKVQSQINKLRTMRLTSFRWMFLTGQIVWWIPFVITTFKLVFDMDAYRFLSPLFMAANLIAGLLAIPLAIYAANRINSLSDSVFIQRLADVIAGRSLSEAKRQAQVRA